MPSQVKNLSPVMLELSVTVPAAEIDNALEAAVTRLSREARIPGFRRGKVPRSVIRRMFGKALLADLRSELMTKATVEAIKEHGIEPVSEPELAAEGIDELASGKDFAFTLEINTAPRLEQVAFDGIEIERREVALPDDLVERQLAAIRSRLATAVDLTEPRPARVGDLVQVELERWIDGEWKKSEPPLDQLVLEPDEIREEFIAALTGAVPGDEREIALPRPDGEGESLRFRARVVGIQERRLPELDDEFARDAGEFETLAGLRADIEQRARQTGEDEERKRMREALFAALREANPMDLPEALVRKQARAMHDHLRQLLGLDPEERDGDEPARAVREEMLADATKTARQVVHQHFFVRELSRLHDLAVTEEDVEAEIRRLAERGGLPVPRVRAEFSRQGRLDDLETSLLEDKIFDFFLGRVKVVDVAAPPADDADGKE